MKKIFSKIASFLKSARLKNVLPYAATIVAGIAAIPFIVSLAGGISEKGEALAEYNSEKADHKKAVKKAEDTIEKYESQARSLNRQAEDLEKTIAEKNKEKDTLDSTISQLSGEINTLSEQKQALIEQTAIFADISPEYNTAEYSEDQLAEIIISQQDLIYEVKKKVSGHIDLIYETFSFSSNNGNIEYLYEVEPPMDITKEFAKEVVGAVAGEYSSEVTDFVAGVANNMIDGEKLSAAVGSQLQSAVQSKIEGARDDLLNEVTGGAYEKFTDVVNVANTFSNLSKKLSDKTPTYCVRYIYLEMQKCIEEMGKFLDDECVTTEDLKSLVETVNQLSILENSYEEVTDDIFVHTMSITLCNDVRDAYNELIVDNERMAYYFALMGE